MDFFIERTRTPEGRDVIRFHGEITDADLARMKLGLLERWVLDGPESTAADHLLKLETLFRTYEEQRDDPR